MAIDLEVIKARCEAATAGPWHHVGLPWDHEGGNIYTGNGDPHSGRIIASVDPMGLEEEFAEHHGPRNHLGDADFIAAARTDVPALVAEVERLRAAEAVVFTAMADFLAATIDMPEAMVEIQSRHTTTRPSTG